MTWQNLPCAPTLPALFAACPHGWAEIEFTYTRGNPTADPPQDADCSIGFGRVWGIDHDDLRGGPCRPPVLDHDVLLDLREPPLSMPNSDCTLLARVVHRAGPCNTCGRQRGPDEAQWFCFPDTWTEGEDDGLLSPSCTGAFPFECVLETCWGVDGKPVVFVGGTAEYGGRDYEMERAEMFKRRCERLQAWFTLPPERRHPLGPEFTPGDDAFTGAAGSSDASVFDTGLHEDDCDANTPRGG